ncbi:DUF58 domain-containing protein [Haloarculaceae archaeon H-GB11]|nr:DUF58 domain-containing protein [Haloarculaceae archaeon H-GB11]
MGTLVLALLAVLYDRPLLLLGAAGGGGYLLAHQYRFVRRVRRLDRGLAVDLSVPQTYLTQGDSSPVTLQAATRETPLSVTVTANAPASTTVSPDAERSVEPDGTEPVTTTFEVSWPTVGSVCFDPPTVTVQDQYGLFAESFERGPTPEVTVEPNRPRRLHVGQGGEESSVSFGAHSTGQLGEGLDPAELRQYVPGDSAGDIDWKATARLNEPHVREHEAETDRRSVLLVDSRPRLDDGRPGETKLDYLREVAVGLADQAGDFDDPLGLYVVDEAGLATELSPSTNSERYLAIKDVLHDLPQKAGSDGDTRSTVRGPGGAQQAHVALAGDASAFSTTLRPYLRDSTAYVRRIESEPLFSTVQTFCSRLGGSLWTFIFTDDSNRVELREAVKLARADGGHVVVFLTPDVLFEPGGLRDLDSAYDQYVEFEEFRRELAGFDRVSVFEVGPGDRLGAILGARRA